MSRDNRQIYRGTLPAPFDTFGVCFSLSFTLSLSLFSFLVSIHGHIGHTCVRVFGLSLSLSLSLAHSRLLSRSPPVCPSLSFAQARFEATCRSAFLCLTVHQDRATIVLLERVVNMREREREIEKETATSFPLTVNGVDSGDTFYVSMSRVNPKIHGNDTWYVKIRDR